MSRFTMGADRSVITRRTFAFGLSFLTVASAWRGGALARDTRAPLWPDGKKAAVSLTYDDGLDSQLNYAAPALDRFGFKATFFLTRENMETRRADWVALARQGHEIGDHTFHHPEGLRQYSAEQFEREEIILTEQFLDQNFGQNPRRLFAYPYGEIELGPGNQLEGELRYIGLLRRHFMAARAADGDPNDPRLVGRERYQLQAVAPTYDKDDPRIAIAYLRKALAWRRWAILIFHDVLPSRLGEGDTSLTSHDMILRWIADHPLWCAPMGEVFSYLQRNVAHV
jgi:peptidoglycan/xylan/chitin deacetylase (PgdA/CDA1 family)